MLGRVEILFAGIEAESIFIRAQLCYGAASIMQFHIKTIFLLILGYCEENEKGLAYVLRHVIRTRLIIG